MYISTKKVQEAKKMLGDKAAFIIAEGIPLEGFNAEKMFAYSPFRKEDNPSFKWNEKEFYFKDFGNGIVIGILDYYMRYEKKSYNEAVRTLFDLVGQEYSNDDFKDVKDSDKWICVKDEPKIPRTDVEKYLSKRGISKETLDFCDVKQAIRRIDGVPTVCIAFQHKDQEGRLVSTKYRKNISCDNKDQDKWRWNTDNNPTNPPILYGINRADITKPLVICEGNTDRLAIVEAGYANVVSVPNGASDMSWVDLNYEFLQSFENIIIWSDDDEPGKKMAKNCSSRLGEYRTSVVEAPPEIKKQISDYFGKFGHPEIDKVDAGNVLVCCGNDTVISLINGAKAVENPLVVHLMDEEEVDIKDLPNISFGLSEMDRIFWGNFENTLTLLTGSSGCVDCDTEFFDGRKWKKISEYVPGDKVLQYDIRNEHATLTYPSRYIKKPCSKMWHFETPGKLDQCLTDEHNVIFLDTNGIVRERRFELIRKQNEMPGKTFVGYFFATFKYNGPGISLSNSEIINECKKMISGEKKSVEGWWYDCSEAQLKFIANSILPCTSFSVQTKEIADFFQFVFAGTQHRTSISSMELINGQIKYLVKSSYRKTCIFYRNYTGYKNKTKIVPYETKDGYKYCFTVDTGGLVLRRNNKVFITGNSGKSTLINTMFIASPIESGEKVFVYSGEINTSILLGNIIKPLASPRHIIEFKNENKPNGYAVTKQAIEKIKKYYRDSIFCYNDINGLDTNSQSIYEGMMYAFRRYGVTNFVLDSLLTIDCSKEPGDDKYEKEASFVKKLKIFTNKNPVRVVLVIHSRKLQAGQKDIGGDDIQGSSSHIKLTNKAFSVSRIEDDPMGKSVRLTCLKDRETGHNNTYVDLLYDTRTYRIGSTDSEMNKAYGWEKDCDIVYYDDVKPRIVSNMKAECDNNDEINKMFGG